MQKKRVKLKTPYIVRLMDGGTETLGTDEIFTLEKIEKLVQHENGEKYNVPTEAFDENGKFKYPIFREDEVLLSNETATVIGDAVELRDKDNYIITLSLDLIEYID